MISELVLYLIIYLKWKKKGIYTFLENDVFENATLSQKLLSPMPFKATVLCSATPATS